MFLHKFSVLKYLSGNLWSKTISNATCFFLGFMIQFASLKPYKIININPGIISISLKKFEIISQIRFPHYFCFYI